MTCPHGHGHGHHYYYEIYAFALLSYNIITSAPKAPVPRTLSSDTYYHCYYYYYYHFLIHLRKALAHRVARLVHTIVRFPYLSSTLQPVGRVLFASLKPAALLAIATPRRTSVRSLCPASESRAGRQAAFPHLLLLHVVPLPFLLHLARKMAA